MQGGEGELPGQCLTCLGSLSLAQLLQGPLKLLLCDLQLLVCLCLDNSRLLQLLLGRLQLLLGV